MNNNQYRKAWEDAKKGTLPKVPLNIDIELSTYCNMKCKMCPHSEMKNHSFMDIKLAKKIINEAEKIGVPAIKLNWRGESTLHPKFIEICHFIRGKKFQDVILNTNGMYRIERSFIIDDTFTRVVFSLDSLYRDILAKIRPGANVDHIVNNIEGLTPSKVTINFTIQRDNQAEFELMAKFCKKCGYTFNPRLMFPRTDHDKDFVNKNRAVTGTKNCGYPFQRLIVSHNGNVYPCCVDWDEQYCVGNIEDQSIKEIWSSRQMQGVRKELVSNTRNIELCRGCTSWLGYEYSDICWKDFK